MEAGSAQIGEARVAWLRGLGVPLLGVAVIVATVAWGLIATASGVELGTRHPPFLYHLQPKLEVFALAAAAVAAAAVAAVPRLRAPSLSPGRFAAAVLVLGLALRLGVAAARQGIEGWYAVYRVPGPEAASEYLPTLPAFDFGARTFLDTFAEIGTSLPVHSVGHPPGLLLWMNLVGIDSAQGMAALTIGVGALSVPLTYLLARTLLEDSRARIATILYLFAPSAVLHGATSADALYATMALLAAIGLLARSRVARALGPPALALASFFSYANLAIGAFAAIVAARRDGIRRALVLSAASGIALVGFYALLHLATGFDPIGSLRSTEIVYREGIASTRPYAFWLFGSPVAFLVASGLPIAWLALRALGSRETVALALFTVLAVSATLGFTKAETERIYLFLVPLACIAAATALPARRLQWVAAALAIQALATELLFYTIW
ncbi:MAG: hypothetical protein ACR2GL_02100 [Thermoleophilaceae bacterium]